MNNGDEQTYVPCLCKWRCVGWKQKKHKYSEFRTTKGKFTRSLEKMCTALFQQIGNVKGFKKCLDKLVNFNHKQLLREQSWRHLTFTVDIREDNRIFIWRHHLMEKIKLETIGYEPIMLYFSPLRVYPCSNESGFFHFLCTWLKQIIIQPTMIAYLYSITQHQVLSTKNLRFPCWFKVYFMDHKISYLQGSR